MNEFVVDTKKYPKPRSRHHNAANVYFPLQQLEKVPKYYPPIITTINWNDVFSNGLPPNILDIGCGWGAFLFNFAKSHPESNILGIEIRKILTDWIYEVTQGEHIHNAHALWYSLPNGLPFLENSSIDTFFHFSLIRGSRKSITNEGLSRKNWYKRLFDWLGIILSYTS